MRQRRRRASVFDRVAAVAALSLACVLGISTAAYTGPADPITEEYKYDELGRLKETDYGGTTGRFKEQLSYDPVGNRTRKTVGATIFSLEGSGVFVRNQQESIKIQRLGDVSKAQRIEVTVTDLTATAGTDYLYWPSTAPGNPYQTSGTMFPVDFTVGQTERTVILEGTQLVQSGESLKVELLNPQEYNGTQYVPAPADVALGTQELTYEAITTGASGGGTGPATFEVAGNVAANEGTSAVVTLRRRGTVSTAHTVTVQTFPGSATSPEDFTAVNTTVSFAANEITKTVSIPIATDALTEPNEVFALSIITADNGGKLGTLADANVTINGTNNVVNTVRVLDAAVVEGGSIDVQLVREGNLSPGYGQYVNIGIYSGTAKGGTDFNPGYASQPFVTQVYFSPGQALGVVTIGSVQDTLVEGDEQLFVVASAYNAQSPELTDPVGRVTITDDDFPGVFTVCSQADMTVDEGVGNAAVQITRLSGNMPATINYSTANDTAVAGEDYTSASGSVGFTYGDNAAKTVNVPIANDNVADPGNAGLEYFDFNISLATGTNGSIQHANNPPRCKVAVIDNDLSKPLTDVSVRTR